MILVSFLRGEVTQIRNEKQTRLTGKYTKEKALVSLQTPFVKLK